MAVLRDPHSRNGLWDRTNLPEAPLQVAARGRQQSGQSADPWLIRARKLAQSRLLALKHLHKRSAAIAMAAGILALSGCNPETSQVPSIPDLAHVRKPYAIKPGVLLPYDPESGEELRSSFHDLILMVRTGQLFPDEARAFIRFKKMQLGLANPTETPGFDRLLSEQSPQ